MGIASTNLLIMMILVEKNFFFFCDEPGLEKVANGIEALLVHYEDFRDNAEPSHPQEPSHVKLPQSRPTNSTNGTLVKRHLAQHLEPLALFSVLASKRMDQDGKPVDTANAPSCAVSDPEAI